MVAQPRTVKLHDNGLDIRAYKRALHRGGYYHRKHFRAIYGPHVKAAVEKYQRMNGLVEDGILGPRTYHSLYPLIDAFGRFEIKTYAARHAPNIRNELMFELLWGIKNHAIINYAEVRPIPNFRWKHHLPLTTDCSGSVTAAYYSAGAPDPNGRNYDGQGFTGTLLAHGTHIARINAKPGDLVVFGSDPGRHVVALLQPGSLHDPLVFSHGHRGSIPDDPHEAPLSVFLNFFSGLTVTYISSGIKD